MTAFVLLAMATPLTASAQPPRGADGKPLCPDGDFGKNTLFAVEQFQRERGLEGKRMAGPKTGSRLIARRRR